MTGRGNGRLLRPSPNPTVKIGISLSTSSPTLNPSSSAPFFLVVLARVLESPRLDTPITLATLLNPLGGISNRSFENITCVSPDTACGKKIEIWPRGWPHYVWDTKNLRNCWPFVTIHPHHPLEIRHEVDRDKILAAGPTTGEKYRVAFTDKCLGTKWWMFGSLDEAEGIEFRPWRDPGEEEDEDEDEEEEEQDKDGPYTRGEDPSQLALVIEMEGEAEFTIA